MIGIFDLSVPIDPMLNGIVDKDVQSMLRSLNLMTNILFCPKFSIENNVIKPNSRLSNFISFIATVSLCVTYNFFLFPPLGNQINSHFFEIFIMILDCIFYEIGFIVNFFFCIILSNKNVQFVLYFQSLHKFINNSADFNRFILWNWIIFALFWIFYIFHCIYKTISMYIFLFDVLIVVILIIFDVKIFYAFRIIKLLANKANLWHKKILFPNICDNSCSKMFCKRMFQAYCLILKCYEIHADCVQECVSISFSFTLTPEALQLRCRSFRG